MTPTGSAWVTSPKSRAPSIVAVTSSTPGARIAWALATGRVSPIVKPPSIGANDSGLGNTGSPGSPNASDEYQRLVGGITPSPRRIGTSLPTLRWGTVMVGWFSGAVGEDAS